MTLIHSGRRLVEMIEQASKDEYVPSCVRHAAMAHKDQLHSYVTAMFTKEQLQIIQLYVSGMTAKEVAVHMTMSEMAVKRKIRDACHRVNAETKVDLGVWLFMSGLLDEPEA